MSAYGTPAAAGQTAGPFASIDRQNLIRLLGGILFASGALVLEFRKTSDWGNWAQFLVVAIPTVVLYALALAGRTRWPGLQPWKSAFYAFGVILLPIALLTLVQAIDDTPDTRLNLIWVFGASTAVAVLTGLRENAWWQMLIGGLYAIVAWIALWSKILDNPSANTIRWLLVALAALLLLAAFTLARAQRPQAADLVTAAGVAAILAGALSLAGLNSSASGVSNLFSSNLPKPQQGWNIYLLIVSLALIAYGSRSPTRGPSYIGALGLTIFIFLVGLNVVARLKGDDASAVAGWPLVLLILGGLLLLAGFLAPSPAGGGPGAAPPPGGPGGPAATYAQQPAAPPPPAGAPGAPAQQPPQPGAPPPGEGGGGLLDQWRTQPPGQGGQQQ
jgi:hypothetical protein